MLRPRTKPPQLGQARFGGNMLRIVGEVMPVEKDSFTLLVVSIDAAIPLVYTYISRNGASLSIVDSLTEQTQISTSRLRRRCWLPLGRELLCVYSLRC